MSGGVTELLLRVTADPSGLQGLAQQFEATEARIVAAARRAGAAIKGVGGGGGSADLARMKSELDQVSAATRTLSAAQEALTQKVEEGGRRRKKASEDVKKAKETEAEAAEAAGRAESRVTQMIVADQVKLAAERARLVQKRVADDAKAAADMAEAESKAVQMVIAAQMKQAEEMKRLRQKRIADDAAAAQQAAAAAARRSGAVLPGGITAAEDAATQSQVTQMILGAEAARKLRAEKEQLSAQQKLSTEAARAEAEAQKELHHVMRGLAGGVGQLWLSYGSLVPLVAGFAVASGIRKTIELGAEFGYQLKFVGAVSGETGAALDAAGGQFMKFAANSQFSAAEVARGARTLAQAGISLADSVKILPDLLRFSTLGEIELAQGAEIAAGTMHAFGLSVADIPHILDSTAKAAQISQTTISEMGQALRQASTVGQEYGVNINEMNALLAVLAQRNIRGSAAGTALMNMFRELDPATAKAQQAFKQLNIQVVDGQGNYRNIIPLLSEFAAKFNQFDQASQVRLARDYFNNRGAKAFLNAMREANGELPRFLKEIEESNGTLKKQAELIEQTFAIQGKEALHVFENSLISAFQAGEAPLTELVKQLRAVFEGDEFKTGITSAVTLFSGLAESVWGVVKAVRALGDLAPAKDTRAAVGAGLAWLGSTMSQQFSDYLDRFRLNDNPRSSGTPEAIAEARRRREFAAVYAGVDSIFRAENQAGLRSFRQSEAANLGAGGNLGYGASNPRLRYDPMAVKAAEDAAMAEVMKENARYRSEEQSAKAHYDAQLLILRAYHSAGLASDDEFNARERALASGASALEERLYSEHYDALMKQRQVLVNKKMATARIDAEIEKGSADMLDKRLKREAASIADAAKEWAKYNNAGQSVLDAAQKGNHELRAEIDLLKAVGVNRKDELLLKIDGRIKTEEETLARLKNADATLEQAEILTAKQLADRAEIAVIEERLAKLRAERAERAAGLKELKELQNDWRVGAIQGLQQYLDTGLSTAKLVADAFKKGFSAMEDALVNFVKTGKLNFKDFVKSVGEDILRLLIRLNITQPLAQWIQGLLGGMSGGSGGGFIGLIGSLLGGGGGGGGSSGGGILGTLGNIGSLVSGGRSIYSFLGTGSSLYGSSGGMYSLFGTPYVDTLGGLEAGGVGQSTTTGLFGQSGSVGWAGAAFWVALAAALGVMSGNYHRQGWTHEGLDSLSSPQYGWASSTPETKFRLLRAFGFSDKAADIMSGAPIMARLFGHRATHADAYGLSGSLTGSNGMSVSEWQDYSQAGGLFRSDRRWTESTALTSGDKFDLIAEMMGGIGNVTGRLGTALGVDPRQALAGYNRDFNVQLSNNGEFDGTALQELFSSVLQDQVSQLLSSAGHDKLSEYIRGLTTTGEELTTTILDLVGALSIGSDIAKQRISVEDVLKDANKTEVERARERATALVELAGKSVLTTQSMSELQNATNAFRDSMVQLILDFENAKSSIDAMFGDTKREILLSGLDDQSKYNFYQTEAENLLNQALSSGSASEIQRNAQLINRDITAAYNLLSPEQQAAHRQEYIDRIDRVNADLQARLTALEGETQDTFNDAVDKMDEAIDKLIADGKVAADKQKEAADIQLEAARTPVRVVLLDARGNPLVTGD